MAKQLNVDVNLNTAKAEAQLKNLQNMLTQAIQGASGQKGGLTKEIVQATEAAAKLKVMLDQSMNPKTGNLDLSKFSQQLSKSKMTLSDYGKQLTNLGSGGEKAFMSLARSVVSAETPMRQSNKTMTELWTTMKNTARWQLSSSALHAFVGGLQNALSYARGLNESLNSIRIVTGQSAEQMNEFAQRANKSAKELSASTLDYTDAALIYYQQGIRDDKEIKARTDATIKMANVTGDSAAKVSNQLTSIWNNFAKGGENLEYYADVITALGAATASSSSEISAGLEKFASIAEETGLSYEYATSSLATIVATTRQSADVVGTALKTIFGRVQSLNLGETLEDGTTLGKYSKALSQVGIDIKDQNGQLKDMDVILDEMGSKWETLNRDQRVALAQAVAGARQYNQLMALMENYDFFKENVAVALGSEGELQKQADIYAESWEAAKTRVRAAAQGIFDELISDDFFISVNDAIAGLLNGVDSLINAMGGLPGVLGMVGSLATKVFKTQMTQGIEGAINGLKTFTGVSTMEANILRQQAMTAAKGFTPSDGGTKSLQMESAGMLRSLKLADLYQKKREQIAAQGKQISAGDAARVTALMQVLDLTQQIAVAQQKEYEAAEKTTMQDRTRLNSKMNIAATKKAKATLGAGASKSEVAAQAKEILDPAQKSWMGFQENAEKALLAQSGLESMKNGEILTASQINGLNDALILQATQAAQREADLRQRQDKWQSEYDELQQRKASRSEEDFPEQDKKRLENLEKNLNKGQAEIEAEADKQRQAESLNRQQEHIKNKLNAEKQYQEELSNLEQDLNDDKISKEEKQEKQRRKNQLNDWFNYQQENGLDSKSLIDKFQQEINPEAFQSLLDDLIADLHLDLDNLDLEEGSFEQWLADKRAELEAGVQAERSEDASDQAAKDVAKEIDNLGAQSFDTLAEGVTNAFQGVSNLTMGFSSLQQTLVTLNNTDLSFGEKFLQVSMSLSMALPMIASGATAIVSGFKGIASGATGMIKSIVLANSAMSMSEKAIVSQKLATDASSISLRKLVASNAQSTAASVAAGSAAGAEASAFGVLGAAAKAAAASIGSMIMTALPFIAIAAAVMAAIIGIKKAVEYQHSQSAEGQLEAAQERAETFTTALQDAKSAAEELNSAFDNYNNVQNALDECTRGTQEWRDALVDANQEVLDILDKYPELAEYVNQDRNGRWTISDEGWETVQQEANDRIIKTQAAKNLADQEVAQKQSIVDQEDILDQFTDGAFVRKSKIQDLIKDNWEDIANSLNPEKTVKDILKDAGYSTDKNQNGVYANPDVRRLLENMRTNDLTQQMREWDQQNRLNNQRALTQNQILAQSALSQDEKYADSKNLNDIANIVARQLPKETEPKREEYEKQFGTGAGKFKLENEANAKKYLSDALGIDLDDLTYFQLHGNGVDYKVEGSDEVQTATKADMSAFLAAADAAMELAGALGSAADAALQNADQAINKNIEGAEAAKEFATTGSFGGATYEDAVEFWKGMDTQEEFDSKMSEVFGKDWVDSLGFESAEKAYQEAQESAQVSMDAFYEAVNTTTDETLDKLNKRRAKKPISMEEATDFIEAENAKLLEEDISIKDKVPKSYSELAEAASNLGTIQDLVNGKFADGTQLSEEQAEALQSLAQGITGGEAALSTIMDGNFIADAEGLQELINEITDAAEAEQRLAENAKILDYHNLVDQMRELTNSGQTWDYTIASNIDSLLVEADATELQIQKLMLLRAGVEDTVAALNEFDQALSADEGSDISDEFGSRLKKFKELAEEGRIGSAAYQEGLEIFMPDKIKNMEASPEREQAVQDFITNTLSRYTDLESGTTGTTEIAHLTDDLEKYGALMHDENGNMHLAESQKTIEDLAGTIGVSTDAMRSYMTAWAQFDSEGASIFSQLLKNSSDVNDQMLANDLTTTQLMEDQQRLYKEGKQGSDEWKANAQKMAEADTQRAKIAQQATSNVQKYMDNQKQYSQESVDAALENYNKLKEAYDSNSKVDGKMVTEADVSQALEAYAEVKRKKEEIEEPSELEINLAMEGFDAQIDEKIAQIKELGGVVQENEDGSIQVDVSAVGSEEAISEISNLESDINEINGQKAEVTAQFNLEKSDDPLQYAKDLAEAENAVPKTVAPIFSAPGAATAKKLAQDVASAANSVPRLVTVTFNAVKTGDWSGSTGGTSGGKTRRGGNGYEWTGSAQSQGSAHESGSWGIPTTETNTLVGELGQELVVSPKTGTYYTVGDNGAEFVNLDKGSIVFNHKQTEELLKYRKINTRGQALFQGNARYLSKEVKEEKSVGLWSNNGKNNNNNNNNNKQDTQQIKNNTKTTAKNTGATAAAAEDIKTYEQQLVDLVRDQIDVYKTLDKTIRGLEHAYKNYTRNNDRLTGQNLMNNMEKGIQAGAQLYQQYLTKFKQTQTEYQKSLDRFTSAEKNGIQWIEKVFAGGTYDKDAKFHQEVRSADGTNMIEFYQNRQDAKGNTLLNPNAVRYDAEGNLTWIDETALQEAAAKDLEYWQEYINQQKYVNEEDKIRAENELANAKARHDYIMKIIDEESSAYNDMIDAEEQAQDMLEELHDLAQEKIVKKLEIQLDFNETAMKPLELKMRILEDSTFGIAESMQKIYNFSDSDLFVAIDRWLNPESLASTNFYQRGNDQWSYALNELDAYTQFYRESEDAINRIFTDPKAITSESERQNLIKFIDGATGALNKLLDYTEKIGESGSKAFEKFGEQIARVTKQMESNFSILDHFKNVADLLGLNYNHDLLEGIANSQLEASEIMWRTAEQELISAKKMRDDAKSTYEDLLASGDIQGAEFYKKSMLDPAEDYYEETLSKAQDATTKFAQSIQNKWTTSFAKIKAAWEQTATFGSNFDALTKSMDKARSVQEELVTTTNKMYETNTLIRKLNQDINKTDSLASKEKLRNFQQEIEGRQKDVQMTKASLDILKARYELLQAEMALEDAKNAKSTVRLQRDNEGNYGYVYTADQDDIDDAEQNLADKQNDLYNLVLNQTNDYHEKMVASRAEYLARVEEIMNDTTIDEQERARQLAELRKQFDQEWQIYEGNITEAVYYLNQEAVDGMSEAYTTMYDDRIVRLDEWMNICNEKEGDLQDLLDEVNSKRNEVKENTVTGLGEIKDRTTDIINENGSLSKQITGNIIPTMESEMIAVSNLTEAFSKKIDKIKETIDYYQNLIDVATQALNLMSMTDNSESSYDHSLRQGDYLVSGNLAGYAEENSLRSKAARNMSKENGYKWNQMELVTIQAIANEQGEDWNVIGNQVLNGKTDFTGKGADVLNLMGSQSSTRSKNNSDDQTALAQYLLDTGQEALAKNINLDQYNMSDEVRKELKNAVSGDTGMYTGEWGSSGKLAILHEKELLLNKDDTLNFLKALEVAKEGYQQAIQMQQLQSLYQQQIEASAASLATNFQNNNENVQQNVTIHAEFPNVTERNEIAEAFKTLVNEASQFANRY